MRNSKTIIIALGGSIIIPSAGKINIRFLKRFRKLILKFVKSRGYRFIIVAGGGKVTRIYQRAAAKITKVSFEDQDWIGIHATRLNAHLLRTVFKKEAYPTVLDNPQKPIRGNFPIVIAAGWRPGWSTDYISVLLAKRFKIKKIIDAGNIPFVYNKDLLKMLR
jgi:uridylate kinase